MIVLTSAHSAGVSIYMPPDTIPVTLPTVEIKSLQEFKTLHSSTPFQRIDARRIKEAGITDISDALRRLPGVNLRDYGGAGGLKATLSSLIITLYSLSVISAKAS